MEKVGRRSVQIYKSNYFYSKLTFDPNKDRPVCIHGGQLLKRLVPFDELDLGTVSSQIVVRPKWHAQFVEFAWTFARGVGDAHNAALIAGGQPAFLVVLDVIESPVLLLLQIVGGIPGLQESVRYAAHPGEADDFAVGERGWTFELFKINMHFGVVSKK